MINEFKNITEKIQILQSNVSKNIEYLEDYKQYKEFLNDLYMDQTNKEEKQKMLDKKLIKK